MARPGDCDVAKASSTESATPPLSPKSAVATEAAGAKLTGSVFGGDEREKVLSGDTNWMKVLLTVGFGRLQLKSDDVALCAGSVKPIPKSSGMAGV
jgi:hypothetical protein